MRRNGWQNGKRLPDDLKLNRRRRDRKTLVRLGGIAERNSTGGVAGCATSRCAARHTVGC